MRLERHFFMDIPPDMWLAFIRPLNRLGVEYMVTGSAASMAYGEPRLTLDVDIVLQLVGGRIRDFVQAFPPEHYYCPPEDVIRVETNRESRGHLNVIHMSSGFKADIYPLGRDPLHIWGMGRRRRMIVGSEPVMLAPPEYVIVRKLEFYREGRSEKHLRDIAGMLRVSGEVIDQQAIEEWTRRLGLTEEWKTALLP